MGNNASAPAAPKVLMVYTSHSKLGETEEKTGWYLPEAAHPYHEFTKAGYTIEMASPKGGEAPLDESSIEASKEDQVALDFAEKEEYNKLWKNTKPLAECKSADYAAVFVVGGFGVMWDLPEDKDMIRLAEEIYAQGDVVSAVCHGPAALVNVKGPDGELLAKGKKVSAFTNAEEDAVSRREVVPWTNEDKYTEIGAEFVQEGAFQTCVSVSERLVTGQNPPSAGATAEAVIKLVNLKVLLTKPDANVPTLYYFDLAGRAEPIRLALAAAGVPFKDERVNGEQWAALKASGSFPTLGGQLPALKHKGAVVGQSMAILKYAGALGNMAGASPMEKLKVDELVAGIEDIFKAFIPTFKMQGDEKLAARKELGVEGGALYTELAKYEAYIEANGNGGYLVGSKMTIADCALVGTVGLISNGWLDGIEKSVCKPFPNICAVVQKVLGEPKVAEYYKDAEGDNTIFQLETFKGVIA